MSEPDHRHHLSTEKAAEYLGVSVSHLEHLRVRGDGPPFYRIDRLVRYVPADAWAESKMVTSTSEAHHA